MHSPIRCLFLMTSALMMPVGTSAQQDLQSRPAQSARQAADDKAPTTATMAPAHLAPAREDPSETIKSAGIVDVPLILESIDATGGATTLWAKGDPPANTVVARLSARPLQVARLLPETGATGTAAQQALLWRAIPGGKPAAANRTRLDLAQGPRIFCGAAAEQAFACLFDKDGNSSFDHVADAFAERGSKPYHVTIMKVVRPLPAPMPYRILSDSDRPSIPIEIRNCDKDYDRPRFSAVSTVDRDWPLVAGEWHQKDSSFSVCRRGRQLTPSNAQAGLVPADGYLAQMGPLLFAVGPKKDAALRLVGPVDADALYRLESGSLVGLSVGPTPGQAQLLARQQFPYPVLMTGQNASIMEGTFKVGEPIAQIPFRHAYRGRLSQDITISTLLYKRSVAAGTIVYGYPARQRITHSLQIGYGPANPISQAREEAEFRDATMQLTWCAPVQGTPPAKEDPKAVGRSGWAAACIPHSLLGTHTIITDLQPAFAVTAIAYDANSSSNDGPPPIERNDQLEFPDRLQVVYTYDGFEGDYIFLNEQIWFGNALTSSLQRKVFRQGRNAVAQVAGAGVELSLTNDGELSVKATGKPAVGASPILTWDQGPMLREQMKKLGFKLVQPGSEGPATAGAAGTN